MVIQRIEPGAAPLSQSDYELLKGGFKRRRDLLICKVLRGTGIRIAEALRITPAHITRDGPVYGLFVARGKTGGAPIHETVWLPGELGLELSDWWRGNGIGLGQPLFKLTSRTYQRTFKAAALQTLGRPAHPHQLRALYLTYLWESGLTVEQAGMMVGHKDPRTTWRHYLKMTPAKAQEIQRQIPI